MYIYHPTVCYSKMKDSAFLESPMRIFLGSSHLQPVIEKNIFKMRYYFIIIVAIIVFPYYTKPVTVGAYNYIRKIHIYFFA